MQRPVKILLLGKNGQVGWELQRTLSVLGALTALGRSEADFDQPDSLRRIVQSHQPDFIVNAAAYTAVDKAESDAEAAQRVNAESPQVLAQEAQKQGAWLIHYSTDYVFNGSGVEPWVEEDATAPLNVYGHTKLAGEQAIAETCAKHIILRTSWVYAARGGNFAKTMRRLARERETLQVVDDQVGAPTGADLIADVTAHIIRQLAATDSQFDTPQGAKQDTAQAAGIYHLAAQGSTSWHGYAKWVIANSSGCIAREVLPVPSEAFPAAARRPLNSRLSTQKLQSRFGLTLPDWRSGVVRMLVESDGI